MAYIFNALERLFSEKNVPGYWDESNRRIIESLYYNEKWQWEYRPSSNYRYSLFCMAMLLLSKELYHLNTTKYDEKISKFLLTIKLNEEKFSNSDLSYGALLSIILSEKVLKLNLIDYKTKTLFHENIKRLLYTTDNNDFLLLIAAYYYIELYPDDFIIDIIHKIQERLLNTFNGQYCFDTGDIRTNYHQRNMYTLWGLLFTAPFGNIGRIKSIAKKILSYYYEYRRLDDNAFLWHPAFYLVKNRYKLIIPICNRKTAKYLFECHQTFYANSINIYQQIFGSSSFQEEKINALDWIWRTNRLNKNLTDITGIDIPVRIMDLKGNLFINGQQFKGSYEIGSYILALSSLNIY